MLFRSLVSMVDSVEVVDDTHFIIHLNTPSNALISSLSHSGCAIFNKAYVEEQLAAGKKIEDAPIGTGPYKFAEWVPGASFTLEKNEDYFDADRKAQNDKLVFKAIPEESARTIALENGELDMLIDVSTNDAGKIRDNSSLALDEYASTWVEYFAQNQEKAPFDDVRVRQAFNHAIKKDDIIVATINNEGTAFNNYIGEAAIGYYDTVATYEYNQVKVKPFSTPASARSSFAFSGLYS